MRKRKTQKKIFFAAGIAIIIFAAIFISACPIESGYLDKIQEKLNQDLAAGGATEPPAAPSDLQAAALSTTQIDLTWNDNSDNEEEFQIQRKKSGSDDWQTETVGADSTTFSDKELDPETEYVYRVRAANEVGESEWTEEVTATTNAVPTYTVTYDGNGNDGGTVPVDGNEYVAGSTVTVSGNTGSLVKTAYFFVGWNTEPDGSGTSYSAGGTFEIGAADIMLYAQWSQNVHTITFNKNDPTATGTMADQDIPEGDTLPLSACGFIKSGWAFIGWSTTPGGSVEYADGANYTMGAADVTLWAQWSHNTHTLTFDKNDPAATGSMSDLNIDEGNTIALPTCGFAKTDWVFVGWSTTPGGSVQYADEADYKMGASDDTLYAQWDPTYTVTYIGNGSTGGDPPTDTNRYAEGETVDVQGSNTLTKTGYTFEEWNTEADGTGIPRGAGSQFSMPAEDVTLYAKWSHNTHTLTFDKNDPAATGSMSNLNIDEGNTIALPTCGFTKTDWVFAGWSTTPGGSVQYSDEADYTMGASDDILYAQWDPTYTVTYVGNGLTGGDPPTDSNRYEEGETVNVYGQNTLERAGYTFIEWNTEADGSGIPRGAGSQFSMPAEDVTLYAQWSGNEYTVTFDKQSGTGGSDSVTATYGTAMPSATAPTRTWYAFAGYWDATTGGVKYYNADMSSAKNWDKTANTTLYARWTEYNLRDTGPAGGLIFYINPDAETDGWKYLECAPQSTEWTSIEWGSHGTDIPGAGGTAVGTGEQNTADIIDYLGTGSTYAAQVCDAFSEGGYNDWFMPSKDELDEMYVNLHQEGVGGFASAYYWSSSEYSTYEAWDQYFGDGGQGPTIKAAGDGRVRAARAF